jgi:hypothetical protein
MGDGSTVDRHDRFVLGEGCIDLSPWVPLRLLALGEAPRGHVVFHHGALFELALDRVCMIWTSHFVKFLKVIVRLSRLVLEIVLGDRDILLIGAIYFHVIVIIAGSNRDLLGAPLLPPLFAIFGASLSTFARGFGWCPPAAAEDCFPIILNEDGPDRFFTRGMLGGDIMKLLRGIQLIATEFMH